MDKKIIGGGSNRSSTSFMRQLRNDDHMEKVYGESITGRGHDQVGWSILLLLLLLRIPYTIAIIYVLPIDNQIGAAIYEVSTYFLTCFLIWWERKRLEAFHVDSIALLLILLIRPVQTFILSYWGVDSPLAFPRPLGLGLWAISLGTMAALRRSETKPAGADSRSLTWLGAGLLVGILMSILENLPTFRSMLSYNTDLLQTQLTPVLYSTSLNVLYHLGFAPVNEEPLFRGFLWGYLRQLKLKEHLIWYFQASLFTSAHLYLARQFPLTIWVFIPAAGLLFGLLAWRSRSIAPAMIAHAMVNGSIYLLIVVLILQSMN
jgi:membrane protease YdiL (CAAX protease family)